MLRVLAGTIAEVTAQQGGASFSIDGRNLSGEKGYAVSVYPDRGVILDGLPSELDISKFILANKDVFDFDLAIGTWFHEGKTYLDLSVVIEDFDEAIARAKACGQLAIYNLDSCEEIMIGEVA